MKKTFALMLVVAMTGAALAGCGKTEPADAGLDAAIADRDTAISSLNVERQRGDELEEKLGRYRDKFGEI